MSLTQFQLSYEISPIILVGGIAANVPGSMIPIINLTQANDFEAGLTSSATANLSANDFVARFRPVAGSTLQDNDIGQYPFANQAVAANAIITKPLRISLQMIAPAPSEGGYTGKLVAFTTLKTSLDTHIQKGGLFTVCTPAFIWSNVILRRLVDITGGSDGQVQAVWQFDFEQPLVTLEAAQSAQNSLMTKISQGLQTSGDPPAQSGAPIATGNPSSGVAPALVPSAANTAGASVGQGAPQPGASQ